jgi:hypothetical protein
MRDVEGLRKVGFSLDEDGVLVANKCIVNLISYANDWQVDIWLPNGSVVECFVPKDQLKHSPAR